MCGIVFTSCSKKINSTKRITPEILEKATLLIDKSNNPVTIKKLLRLTWIYKSDLNFIHYHASKKERKKIDRICNKLANLIKRKKNINELKDIKWLLDDELKKRYYFVNSFTKNTNFNKASIVFYKTLNAVINSINLLEIRGRDSLGLMLSMCIKKNLKNENFIKKITKNKNYQIKIKKDKIYVNIIYKTFNIFGSLGENANKIIEKIRKDKTLLKIINGEVYDNINIIAHTRWASTGSVNLPNTHPIVNLAKESSKVPMLFSVMNGEIKNYKKLILANKKLTNVKYNTATTSDTLALSLLLANNFNIEGANNNLQNKLKNIEGSFASISICDEDISKVILIRMGNTGIYYGKNKDRKIFSSDANGLVEESKKFCEIKKNTFCVIDSFDNKSEIRLNNLFSNSNETVKDKVLLEVSLTTRDLSKKHFKYYFEKEISESGEIVEKTISNYINLKNTKSFKKDHFNKNISKSLNELVKKLRSKQINEITIIGMGTCFTAANHIAFNMKKVLSKFLPDLKIKAQLSSECSAFNLKSKMNKSAFIAIAQSGTTKDTNVCLDLVKSFGAYTLCFLNKKNGDISYIVDKTLYIGDGRDIETSVPSSKTFIAHIILGQIFTLYLASKFKMKKIEIKKEIENISKIPRVISKTLNEYKKYNFSKLYKFFLHKNWFVTYDEVSKKHAGMEIRIKLSECCYRSLLQLNVKNLISYEIKNSIVIYHAGVDQRNLKYNIKKLNDKNNIVVLIGDQKLINVIKNNPKIYKIYNTEISSDLSIIPTVINGQLLSFNVAKEFDKRKLFFESLKNLILEKKNISIKKSIIKLKKITFKFDYPLGKIEKLVKKLHLFLLDKNKDTKEILILINLLQKYSFRPIDTVKHQAKTITVGTDREQNKKFLLEKNNFLLPKTFKRKKLDKNKIIKLNFKNHNNVKKIYLYKNVNLKFYLRFIKNYVDIFNKFTLNAEIKIIIIDYKKPIKIDKQSIVIELNSDENKIDSFIDFDIRELSNYIYLKGNNIKKIFLVKEKSVIITNFINIINIFNSIILNLNKKNNQNKFLLIMNNIIIQLEDCFRYIQLKNNVLKLKKLKNVIKNSQNLKFLGSNYNFYNAKFLAHLISKSHNKSCAYDTLENHKHIDMSAEPLLITLLKGTDQPGYLLDCYSELEKCISHNNIPFIVSSNLADSFDKMEEKRTIDIPIIQKETSIVAYIKLFEANL